MSYRGRVDDQYLVGAHRTQPTRRHGHGGRRAAGRQAGEPTDDGATGCVIRGFVRRSPRARSPMPSTWPRSSINTCRVPSSGRGAPFPLTSFAETAAWSDTIREVVSEGRMPPWFADAQFGKFSNDCSLSDSEKQTLLAWIDNGCPEGKASETPSPPVFTAGWRMGKPDAVYQMVETYTVPSEGKVEYQYFLIDPKLESDAWISCARHPAIRRSCTTSCYSPFRQERICQTSKRRNGPARWLRSTRRA